jgi:hypothetical protein
MKTLTLASLVLALSYQALAESQYPIKRDGTPRLQRTGTCPTGYIGSGNFCDPIHNDTPSAMPKIKGAACPSGTFASGDACKAFR